MKSLLQMHISNAVTERETDWTVRGNSATSTANISLNVNRSVGNSLFLRGFYTIPLYFLKNLTLNSYSSNIYFAIIL
jgi:hypothetical protein